MSVSRGRKESVGNENIFSLDLDCNRVTIENRFP